MAITYQENNVNKFLEWFTDQPIYVRVALVIFTTFISALITLGLVCAPLPTIFITMIALVFVSLIVIGVHFG
jgi:uncharacterized membrane protein